RPRQALDYFLSGLARQQQGRLPEAAADYVNALRDRPDHFWARYFLGLCNLQLLRPAEARENFTACLGSRKDDYRLYLLRGFANGQLDEFRAAEEDYRQALALQPDRQARYGILVNQGDLCLRQARLVDRANLVPWPLPFTPNLAFAYQGAAAEVYRTERLDAAA